MSDEQEADLALRLINNQPPPRQRHHRTAQSCIHATTTRTRSPLLVGVRVGQERTGAGPAQLNRMERDARHIPFHSCRRSLRARIAHSPGGAAFGASHRSGGEWTSTGEHSGGMSTLPSLAPRVASLHREETARKRNSWRACRVFPLSGRQAEPKRRARAGSQP